MDRADHYINHLEGKIQHLEAQNKTLRNEINNLSHITELNQAAEKVITQIIKDCATFQDLLLSIETYKEVSKLYWDFCKLRKEFTL